MPTSLLITNIQSGVQTGVKTGLPTIAVHCFGDGDQLLYVNLTLGSSFSFHIHGASTPLKKFLTDWIENYLKNEKTPLISIPPGTLFQQSVWQALQKAPYGSTVSYGELALQIGKPKGGRAVGNACNKNPYPLFIPCHRVIQAGKKIGGFAFDLEIKKKLLEFESGEWRIK